MPRELASLIAANTNQDGVFSTAVPGLYLYRHSRPTVSVQGVMAPALAIVAQGAKSVTLGNESYLYNADHYLVVSVDLPLTGNVTSASRAVPYLGIRYDLDVVRIASLRVEGKLGSTKAATERGIYVSRMTPGLADAVLRLMRLLKTPDDIEVLAPLLHQEILYRLLRGDQGAILERIAQTDSHTQRIMRAVNWLKANFSQPFSIEAVANVANMSPSALHEHFRRLTSMSPLQFQKQLCLQEARRLLLAQAMDAASAAYEVGYVSPSQFSREYTRLFGMPPLRDIEHLRSQPQTAAAL